jgi:hypothetical protein
VSAVDRWDLYCENDRIYSTTDKEDADSWVAADPGQHTARLLSAEEQDRIAESIEKHRATLDVMGKGGWTGATGLE